MNPAKSLTKIYNNMTTWSKILLLFALLLIGYSIFSIKRENFQNTKNFVFNDGPSVYDDFYSEI